MNWRHWLLQVAIAVDQLANVLITPGSDGAWADESMSSRAYRMDEQGKPWGRVLRPAIDFVFGAGHCRRAYLSERLRLQSPPEERTCTSSTSSSASDCSRSSGR